MFYFLGIIIFLDGGVCAGKTSLLHEFKKDNFVVIPEHTDLISKNKEKWVFSLKDDNLILEEFMKIEKIRNIMILSALIDGKNIVVDRSVISTLSFYYAIGKYELVEKYLYENQIFYPEKVYFLDISHDERIRRAYQRGDTRNKILNNVLYNEDFNKKLKHFFLNVQKNTKVEYINASKMDSKKLKQYILKKELDVQNIINNNVEKMDIKVFYKLNLNI